MRRACHKKAKDNPKAISNYIKSKSKTREGIADLHLDPNDPKSEKTDDDKTKAEILAKYFSSVFTEEPEGDIPNPKPIKIKEKMPELIINEEMVLKQLNSLKIDKSPGLDELHPRLLKELAKSLNKTCMYNL